MKTIFIIMSIVFGSTSTAARLYSPDEFAVITNDNIQALHVTRKEYFGLIREIDPELHEWCVAKGSFAEGMMIDRGNFSRDKILEAYAPLKKIIPHYRWVDIQRMLADIHRYNSKGEFMIRQDKKIVDRLKLDEFHKCLVNGF